MGISLFWPNMILYNSIYISKLLEKGGKKKMKEKQQIQKEAMGVMDMSTLNMVSVL